MPEEIIQVEDQYYILAQSRRADDRTRVIKHGESFGVFDSAGSIRPIGLGEQGLYHEGTRFLSRFELALHGRRLQPLRSTVLGDHLLVAELTNPDDLTLPEPLPREVLHVTISCLLYQGSWYARVTVHNFALRALEVDATIRFAADYVDIFEIRGKQRPRRGVMCEPQCTADGVTLGYRGLDGVTRETQLQFRPTPRQVAPSSATWQLHLPPHGEQVFELTASFVLHRGSATEFRETTTFDRARELTSKDLARTLRARIEASNPRIEEWIERSACDLRMMTTHSALGPYPYAGVPWYSTVFGRDGIITAFQTLWLDPSLGRGVLAQLAALQATTADPARDAEPGKIIHEMRHGEMAALGEIPFGRYYGSVDATPLFIALAGAYFRRTGDREFIATLWPHVLRALEWIDADGDLDGDGFVEYARRTATGLVSQGWKDSADSISHRDGTLAEGPIALCEVQGYVYAAFQEAAGLARMLGDTDRANALESRAADLRARFVETFWSDELGMYCLALDGAKRPCLVRASNAGHALWSGIATSLQAASVSSELMNPHMFSGWGVRTLDDRELRYNPLSYHNGSVWPHDNAIVALGMARYGHKEHALAILDAMYRASVYFDLHRMPELFCGFPRLEHDGPTPYPVACSPQSWAAGAVFMLLQACLGIDVDAPQRRLRLVRPVLPENIEHLRISDLQVGDARVDLALRRHRQHLTVNVERCEGELEIVVVKRDGVIARDGG